MIASVHRDCPPFRWRNLGMNSYRCQDRIRDIFPRAIFSPCCHLFQGFSVNGQHGEGYSKDSIVNKCVSIIGTGTSDDDPLDGFRMEDVSVQYCGWERQRHVYWLTVWQWLAKDVLDNNSRRGGRLLLRSFRSQITQTNSESLHKTSLFLNFLKFLNCRVFKTKIRCFCQESWNQVFSWKFQIISKSGFVTTVAVVYFTKTIGENVTTACSRYLTQFVNPNVTSVREK